MTKPNVVIDAKANELVIRIKIEPAPSKSKKSLVLASTHGNIETECTYEGDKIYLGLNAYVKEEK